MTGLYLWIHRRGEKHGKWIAHRPNVPVEQALVEFRRMGVYATVERPRYKHRPPHNLARFQEATKSFAFMNNREVYNLF